LATILLNKPPGYVSNLPEKGYPEAVSLIRRENQQRGRPGHGNDSVPAASTLNVAGRLDIDSSGLLVLTQNGSIARRLISPDSRVEKEYRVRVSGSLDDHTIAQLCHGLSLDGRVLRPARVTQHGAHQLIFILVEGRKRQIRRMCELVGLKVNNLTRTRIGGVTLGRLPRGQWRYLGSGEQF
jgi:23S rRNA pseudouridine2604 synthase